MCGFVGVLGTEVPEERLESLADRLGHRGPDDRGSYRNDAAGVSLAHRRLSIIDVECGRQPLSKRGCVVVYNGEIYNYRELRERLIRRGHSFSTESDTEVLMQTYLEWGRDCLQHLRGMFSFLLWDGDEGELFLARDRFGQKPLFYTEGARWFAAASEIQGLLPLPGVSREVNPSAIPLYLGLQYIPSPHSGFRDVKKLPPAHYMVVREGEVVERKRYWHLRYQPKHSWDFEQSQRRVRSVLDESIRLRMRSDVPLGAFLSGGIDSSIVVSRMARLAPRAVRTVSISFEGGEDNELEYARQVAQRYSTDHQEYHVTTELEGLLPRLARHFGEPFADSSAIPVYYVSRQARERVKVALTGDGGDELFGGYGLYQRMQSFQRVGSWMPRLLTRGLSALMTWTPHTQHGRSAYNKLVLLLRYLRESPASWYFLLASYCTERQIGRLMVNASEVLREASPEAFCQEEMGAYDDLSSFAERAMAFDARRYLPEDLLFKVDVASMMNSLECRSPFLDHRLAELTARLPVEHKLGRGESGKKRLLKAAFQEELPEGVLAHRKTGFGIPRSRWLRGPLSDYLRQTLRHDDRQFYELFEQSTVQQWVQRHLEGSVDFGPQLWALLMFKLWMREMQVKLP